LIRSLYDSAEGEQGRVLYLNVDGLTNLAIAEGTVCRFTRVIGGGVEAMASDLAARRGIPLTDARALLATVDLSASAPSPGVPAVPAVEHEPEPEPAPELHDEPASQAVDGEPSGVDDAEREATLSREEHEAREASMGYAETVAAAQAAPAATPVDEAQAPDADIRAVLEGSVRDISGEIRNSLDFHRTQEQGGQVSHVALSGAVLDLPGFADALQASLGMEVRSEEVGLVDTSLQGKVSTHRLAVAAGLATAKAPQ
jgi:cell division ATPase FtsA